MIPEEKKKQIVKDALKKYSSPHGQPNPETSAYMEGRKDEAEKALVLKEALEKIIKLKDKAQSTQDLFPVLQEIDKARKILTQYNKP